MASSEWPVGGGWRAVGDAGRGGDGASGQMRPPAARVPAACGASAPDRLLDPLLVAGGLCLLLVVAAAVELTGAPRGPAQQITAATLMLGVLGALYLSPRNGLLVLFLAPPLFNGEDLQPYFFLLEILVYLTLAAGAVFGLRHRRVSFPCASVFVLFLVSTLVSFPLNAGELWLQVQAYSWRDIVEGIRRSDLWDNLFYVRTVLNVASGIGLYVLTANQRWRAETLDRLVMGVALILGAVTLAGLLWSRVFLPQSFLSLRLHGWMNGGFSGVGFNTSYFAQYALAYLPLVVLVLARPAPRWAKAVAVVSVIGAVCAVVVTYQRGAYVVLLVELGLLVMVGLALRSRQAARASWIVLGLVGAVLAAVASLALFTPVGARAVERLVLLWNTGDAYRSHVLGVTARMFLAEPLLGIGSGRFAHMFQFYSPDPAGFQWGSLSSHNLYAQFLAEQGALGLLSFLGILGLTAGRALWRARQLDAERLRILVLLVSLGAWLTYGMVQYTFLMRSMQIYFWILLGFLASAQAAARGPSLVRSSRWAVVLAIALALAVGLRVQAAASRPIQPGLALGFHAQEGDVRWTRSGAVLNVAVEGRILRVFVACPIPEVASRPQEVVVLLDALPVRRLVLDTPAWRTIEIPVDRPVGTHVQLQIRAGYTFVPAVLGHSPDTRRLGVLTGRLQWLQ